MTKIGYISDLHGDLSNAVPYGNNLDVLVLAGDVFPNPESASSFIKQIEMAFGVSQDVPIVCVLGNHEYYNNTIDGTIADYKKAFKGLNVSVLEKESVEIDGIEFLGATLWSDLSNPIDAWAVSQGMNDFVFIHEEGKARSLQIYSNMLQPETYHRMWEETVSWIDEELGKDRKRVVVTHHSPSGITTPPQFRESRIRRGYYSDMDDLILEHKPDLWIYGHDHVSAKHTLGDTRIVSNQAGYRHERSIVQGTEIQTEEI